MEEGKEGIFNILDNISNPELYEFLFRGNFITISKYLEFVMNLRF